MVVDPVQDSNVHPPFRVELWSVGVRIPTHACVFCLGVLLSLDGAYEEYWGEKRSPPLAPPVWMKPAAKDVAKVTAAKKKAKK